MKSLLLALLLLPLAALAAEPRAPRLPADLKITDNIVFKQIGDTKLELMLFQLLAKKFAQAPLVIYIHGGGWGKGDRYKALRQDIMGVIRSLNQQGVACASIEYRLADGAANQGSAVSPSSATAKNSNSAPKAAKATTTTPGPSGPTPWSNAR